ncbi:histidine--tRNA ligase [Candidatus Saccharibacteria bacterium TM7i]|nr:histidine--tRNA ligase [Candidatus Saccharibacteria bacterium TM7i]
MVEYHGYEEYGAPILEPLELYAAKSGQELINEQTYAFTDRGGREVSIRPEMTPSISRMVAAKRQELAYPARLYSIANFMRYERPQRGREREFWQLNADIFGVDGIQADIEIITISDQILKEFGATSGDYIIKINSRVFINHMMTEYLGLDDERALQMTKIFDRRNKLTEEAFTEQVKTLLGDEADEKLEKTIAITKATSVEILPDELQHTDSLKEIHTIFDNLQRRGVTDIVFDATLMRGLDYYTGTVFEVADTHPDNNRSLFGGGRYDGLAGLFGAEPISAVGVTPGNTMIEHFLEVHGLLPDDVSKTDAYVVTIGDAEEVVAGAQKLAAELREGGLNIEVDITGRKLDRQIKAAAKKNIQTVIFVVLDEIAVDLYSVKNLSSGSEVKCTSAAIVTALK